MTEVKKICLVLACLGLSVCLAGETATGAAPASPKATEKAVSAKRLTPEELQAMREKARASRAAREEAEAKKQGVTVDELRKRNAEERRALREKHEAAMAAKAGVSVEEFRQKRRAKHDEMLARRLGVTVEEVRKMTPEQKRSRYREILAKRRTAAGAHRAAHLHGCAAELTGAGELKGDETKREIRLPAWRNEQVSVRYLVWSDSDLKDLRLAVSDFAGEHGGNIPAAAATARFVSGDGSVWLSLAVPKEIAPDTYRGTLTATDAAGGRLAFSLVVDVRYDTLNGVRDWGKASLDLVARLQGPASPQLAAFRDAVENVEKMRQYEESRQATWRLVLLNKKYDFAALARTNETAFVSCAAGKEAVDIIDYMSCPGYLHGRKIEYFTETYGADLGYAKPVQEVHLVQRPVPAWDRPGRPLYVVLHSSGHNAVNSLNCTVTPDNHDIYHAPDDFFALYLDCRMVPGDWWYGINRTPGFDLSPCERRMLRTLEETVVKYGIDRERIYLCGNSMGGSGCLGFGIRHGDIFAAVKGNVPALTQHACDRMGWDWKADRDVAGAPWRELPDPPLILDHTAPNDMKWSEGREHFYRMMEARRYPFQAYWADHKHCNRNSIITAANDLYLAFDWTSVRKSDLLPSFSHASCDTPCPWPDHRDAKGAGQMNAFFRWANGRATERDVSIDLFIGDLKSKTLTVPETAVTDVTLRRTGAFKVRPGAVVRWTFGAASGQVTVGDDARVTIPKLTLTKTPTRLTCR